jgi:hypothetical protein
LVFRWKLEPAQVYTTADDGGQHVTLTGANGEHTIPFVDQMEILGSLLTTSTLAAVDYRLGSVASAFWAHALVIQAREIPARKRFEEFRKRVYTIATYNCSTWIPSNALLRKLISWERERLRRMIVFGRKPDETFEAWR